MYILNYILMASGILFLIAMTLIFFGLFWTPRVKFTENEVHDDYPSPVIRSGRHIIDASDEYDDDADETSNDDLQDDADLDD